MSITRQILWKDRKRILFGLPWSFTKYSLSPDRLFIESGIINAREDEVRLYRILDLSLNRSFWQRLFGLGTIHCCSGDKSMGDFDIKNIKKPREVKELLSDTVEKERVRNRVVNRENLSHHDGDEGEHSHDDDGYYHDHDDDDFDDHGHH